MFKWFKKKDKNEKIQDKIIEDVTAPLEDKEEKKEVNPVEGISENVKDIVEKVEKVVEIKEKVIEAEETVEKVEEKLEEVTEKINKTIDKVDDKIEEVKDVIEEVHEEAVDELIEEIIEEVNEEVKEQILESIEVEEPVVKKLGFFDKLKSGLTRTRDDISGKIDSVLKAYQKIDEELFEDLEEVLISADVGMDTTMELIDRLKDRIRHDKVSEPDKIRALLKDEIKRLMLESVSDNRLNLDPSPAVILVVGVNGVGKTTTIGKLSNSFKNEGKKVLIAAGDTFRAAAIEQLEEWSNRSGVEFISHKEGADPAAVIFDGIQAAKARKADILICDTAGRLHNKSNLMNELNKIFRVVEREYGEATKEILLVLDATTGQNAINQAKVFKEVANITGVALTKLDGTAKGGVVIALQSELKIPIKLIGVGEGIDDLQPFNTEDFVEALF